MNTHSAKILLVAACVAAHAWSAAAQSSNSAAPDYAGYARTITDRNIFDPARFAHNPRTPQRTTYRPRTRSNAAPAFSLVGTMSYEKGRFAFFSGNTTELKKILVLQEGIAGYTMTEISATQVTLEAADKKKLVLRVGDVMRQESGQWELAGPGEVSSEPAAVAGAPAEPGRNGGEESAAAATGEPAANPAAASSGAASEILKRLMQKREQESK